MITNAERLFTKEADIARAVAAKGIEGVFSIAVPASDNLRVCCIDEGTEVGPLRLAGCGILLGKTREESLERAAEIVKAMGARELSWHKGCGAVAVYLKAHPEIEGSIDEVAERFVRELALKVNLPYYEQPLVRPASLHIARAVYYDGTGKFVLPERWPTGFGISRCWRNGDALREMEMAIGIAFGEHGFGELFTAGQPFLLIAVGDDHDPRFSAAVLENELKVLAATRSDRVKVLSFTPRYERGGERVILDEAAG